MDFWELLTILVRRWLVFLPLLAVTVVTAVTISGRIEPTYSAQASIVLLGPAATTGQNAYLTVGIPTTAQTVALSASDAQSRREVAAAGNSVDYEVNYDRRSPILSIVAEGQTPEQATNTVRQVMEVVKRQLQALQDQAGATPHHRISSRQLTGDILPAPVTEGAQRVKIVVLGVGVSLAAVAALVVEGLARARRRRSSLSHNNAMVASTVPTPPNAPHVRDANVPRPQGPAHALRVRPLQVGPPHVGTSTPTPTPVSLVSVSSKVVHATDPAPHVGEDAPAPTAHPASSAPENHATPGSDGGEGDADALSPPAGFAPEAFVRDRGSVPDASTAAAAAVR